MSTVPLLYSIPDAALSFPALILFVFPFFLKDLILRMPQRAVHPHG